MTELQILNLPSQPDLDKGNNNNNGTPLQLSPISVNEDYCKEWNIHENDFVCLTLNSKLLRPTLYRVGGMGSEPNGKNYFMLLKYVEAYYSKDILRMSKSNKPKHLEGRWCIIDKNGIEKVEFPHFKNPYLVDDSQIYSIEGKYYNIETGEFYCSSYSSMRSSEFLFLENNYDKDKSKQGVMKINKKDGTWELFS